MHFPPPEKPARPLSVLHLTLGADAGGLSRYVVDLAAAMANQGHAVAAAGDDGAWRWAFDAAPFPYLQIPLKAGPVGFAQSVRAVRRWLADHPVDVIHTHYRRATLLGRFVRSRRRSVESWGLEVGSEGGGKSKLPTTNPQLPTPNYPPPLLYTVHLSDLSLAGPRRWLSDFGDHTHVASVEARRWVVDDARVPPGRVTLIPHGIDPATYPLATPADRAAARAALDLTPSDHVGLFVGRLDYPKNEHWLLTVAEQSPGAIFLLVGEGPHEADLRAEIARRGLAGRVRLLGHRDPLACYRAADLLLLPSIREGFSYVCAEAMSVGLPVLRTRTAGTEELIVEGETGRSVPLNESAFANAAAEMLSDPAALRHLGATAAAHVREHFTFDRQVERTVDLYRALARRRTRSNETTEAGRA